MQRWSRYYQCVLHGRSSASTLLHRVRQLPEMCLATVIGTMPILIVAPHPDDETLGCAGLISDAIKLGNDVRIAVVTDGARSHPRSRTHSRDRLRELRRCETVEAAAVLGVAPSNISFLNVPDGHAPHSGKRARIVGKLLAALACGAGVKTIFTSWNYDTHPDHVATYNYASLAAREVGARLFSYPVWAWTMPPGTVMPDLKLHGFSIDIRRNLAMKRAALMKHRSQTSSLISDDPSGFMLSEEHLKQMITDREFFIQETN